ncbi:MAG TPA: hypothetical protein VI462_10990 [Acidimicrobiia bacterium]
MDGPSDATVTMEGLGLGLSIVAAIAGAHGASVTSRARRAGGLDIEVRFPLASSTCAVAADRGDDPRHTSRAGWPRRRVRAAAVT